MHLAAGREKQHLLIAGFPPSSLPQRRFAATGALADSGMPPSMALPERIHKIDDRAAGCRRFFGGDDRLALCLFLRDASGISRVNWLFKTDQLSMPIPKSE
jgi:hypothetical protein